MAEYIERNRILGIIDVLDKDADDAGEEMASAYLNFLSLIIETVTADKTD